MIECEGCSLGMDWCYMDQAKKQDYQVTCPCKECLIKVVCSKTCDKRHTYLYLARIASKGIDKYV